MIEEEKKKTSFWKDILTEWKKPTGRNVTMRKNLFRGKAKAGHKWIAEGEWIEGSLLCFDDENGTVCKIVTSHLPANKDEPIMSVAYEVDPKTVCQCTGLTDKSGNKVFEGDIVKYHFGEDAAPIRFGAYQNCFDSTEAEHCGFFVDWDKKAGLRKDLGYWIHMVDAEIVGNIFDGKPQKESHTVQQAQERLAQYEGLGVTPDQIREMDRLYAEKCREAAELKRRLERMTAEMDERHPKKTSMEWAAHISERFCRME